MMSEELREWSRKLWVKALLEGSFPTQGRRPGQKARVSTRHPEQSQGARDATCEARAPERKTKERET